jgi:hypothetical protein
LWNFLRGKFAKAYEGTFNFLISRQVKRFFGEENFEIGKEDFVLRNLRKGKGRPATQAAFPSRENSSNGG